MSARYYNVARSASEIADYYASGIEMGVDAHTIALWCMNGDARTSQKMDDKGFYSLDLTEVNAPAADFSFICARPIEPDNFVGVPL